MNKRKGISLVVLIITIVVVIILAAAVILTLSKNNPVESAKEATFVSDLSSYQDELTMYIGNEYAKAQGDFDAANLNNQLLEEIIEINQKYNEKFVVIDGKIAGTDKLTDQEREWAKIITGGVIGSALPPVISNYTDTDGNVAYIPTGFSVSTVESEKKIDTGLVIKDNSGNEFVWIPVNYTSTADFNSKFVCKQGYYNGSLQTNYPYSFTEPYSSAGQSEIDEYTSMVKSVKKYRGYYIARYEASKDGSGNALSKPNKPSWNKISWGSSMIDATGGAVEKSRAMYPVSAATQGSAVSTLIYGAQWDTAIDFIENYGEKNTTFRRDSTGMGNYSGITNGSNSAYVLNNIYDMAGNLFEWTMEAYSTDMRVSRGGCCNNSGLSSPVSYRQCYSITINNAGILGFRISLYIM